MYLLFCLVSGILNFNELEAGKNALTTMERLIQEPHPIATSSRRANPPRRAIIYSTAAQDDIKKRIQRQGSFKTNFNPDFDQQGHTGACHVFATLEVLYDVTGGLKLSKEKLYLDNLFAQKGIWRSSLNYVVDSNIEAIKRMRSKPCDYQFTADRGTFEKNMKILRTFGGVVVPHNGDWKEIENIMQSIKVAESLALDDEIFDESVHRARLFETLEEAYDRSEHLPEEKVMRREVRKVLSRYRCERFVYEGGERDLLKNTYNLIMRIQTKGTAYLSVCLSRFYSVVLEHKNLSWKLGTPKVGTHAVALVGYSVAQSKFFIKDSNLPKLITISPKNLFLSMARGVVLTT